MIALALRYWWAVVIAGLLLALGAEHVRAEHHKAAFADYRAKAALLVAQAEHVQREKERQWGERMQEVRDHARDEKNALASDLADAGRTADGLREQRDFLARRARAQACAAGRGADQPRDDPIGVLAELSARADALAEVYARTADQRAIIARACERAADAMN